MKELAIAKIGTVVSIMIIVAFFIYGIYFVILLNEKSYIYNM